MSHCLVTTTGFSSRHWSPQCLRLESGAAPAIPISLHSSSDLCQDTLFVCPGRKDAAWYLQLMVLTALVGTDRKVVLSWSFSLRHKPFFISFCYAFSPSQFQLFPTQKLNSPSSCIYLIGISNEISSSLFISMQESSPFLISASFPHPCVFLVFCVV